MRRRDDRLRVRAGVVAAFGAAATAERRTRRRVAEESLRFSREPRTAGCRRKTPGCDVLGGRAECERAGAEWVVTDGVGAAGLPGLLLLGALGAPEDTAGGAGVGGGVLGWLGIGAD